MANDKNITNVDITPRLFISRFMTSGVGVLLGALHGLISLPIYTGFLEVGEYGILRIVMITTTLLQGLFSFRLANSVSVYSAGLDDSDEVSKNFFLGLAGTCASMALCTVIFLLTYRFFLPSEVHTYIWYILFMLYGFVLVHYATIFVGTFQLIMLRTVSSLVQIFGTMILAMILMYRGGGVESIFIATIVLSYAVFAVLMIVIVRKTGVAFAWDSALLWEFVKFAAPLIPITMSGFVIQNLDQYFILHYMGKEAVAIYGVATSMVFYMQSFLGAIFTTYSPTLYRLWDRKEYDRFWKYTRRANHLMIVFFGYSLVGLALYSPALIHVLARKKELWSSTAYVIPLGCALIFAILGRAVLPYFYARKNSSASLYVHLAGAALNCTLNVLLIPRYGIMGAVIATIISYIVYFLLIAYMVKRDSGVSYDFPFLLRAAAVTAPVLYLADRYVAHGHSVLFMIAMGIPFLSVYTALLAAVKCVTKEDVEFAKNNILKKAVPPDTTEKP